MPKLKKLLVGSAPDTFLGAGFQTCRKVVDDGWLGRVVGGTAFFMGKGPEVWHSTLHSSIRRAPDPCLM